MGGLADKLRQDFKRRVTDGIESAEVEVAGEKTTIYWKPLTGRQQKAINAAGERSIPEGICMHVKVRALDEHGVREFKDVELVSMMNDFDFDEISKIYIAMTGIQFSAEDIAKN